MFEYNSHYNVLVSFLRPQAFVLKCVFKVSIYENILCLKENVVNSNKHDKVGRLQCVLLKQNDT